ncbi:MAG: DUF2510 domain-containing protein [Leifsonia sp.]
MTSDFPAGWYPDYEDNGRLRYWNGAAWTDRTTPRVREEQGPPPPPPKAAPPTSAAPTQPSSVASHPGLAIRAAHAWDGIKRSLRRTWRAPTHWPKRTLVVSIVVVAVVVLAGVTGITYGITQHNNAVASERAAAKAAHAKAIAEEQQRQKDIAEATAKQDREDALSTAATQLESGETLYTQSAAWGDAAARQELQAAIDAMKKLLTVGDEASTDELGTAYAALATACAKVGTVEAAQDRQYKSLVDHGANAGRFTASAAGRDYCSYLDKNYTTDSVFQMLWTTGTEVSEIDVAAVRVYCPKYEAAMNLALSAIFDGTHVDGQNGFTAGPWHTTGGVANCYWELSDGHGNIADNNFINAAPGGVSVSVEAGQTFMTTGCKAWVRG